MFKDVYAYYRDPDVRARIIEFLGGSSLEEATCIYLCRNDSHLYDPDTLSTPDKLPRFLDQGHDLCRSLWDRESVIAHLDMEYVNFDFPGEPFLNRKRCFKIQQPVVWAVQRELLRYGIAPLHLLTGRGHHFLWRIRWGSDGFHGLADLGGVPKTLRGFYATPRPPTGERVPDRLGAAFEGLGRVMEHLCHRIKVESAPVCRVPVELTAVAVGPVHRGREMVSLDISEYGDPLSTRMIRVPYSAYYKPGLEHSIPAGFLEKGRFPSLISIPLHELDVMQGLEVMCEPVLVRDLAARASVRIPAASGAMERLVDAYHESPLKSVHDFFYSQEQHPPETWPDTYDRTPLDALPQCTRHLLEHPDERLLKPAGIELVVRSFLALGWHPRHVAGLIRSKYERDHGWGSELYRYDAATRADFYVRIFSSLFSAGVDDLMDFNCTSSKEKRFCFYDEASCSLDRFRDSLLERREHGRLARRPFNRLFLPNEHF